MIDQYALKSSSHIEKKGVRSSSILPIKIEIMLIMYSDEYVKLRTLP